MMPVFLLLGVAAASPVVLYGLEDDDGGFIESGETGQWAWGVVRNGPGSGYDGAHAWSTGLERDYLVDSVDYLEIPVPDLSGAARPMLTFQHWYDLASGDYGWIEAKSDGPWEPVTPLYGYPAAAGFTGTSVGWQSVALDLSGLGSSPRVRFVFVSDESTVGRGWNIDNVGIYDGDVAPPKLSVLTELPDTEEIDEPYLVQVIAEDDTAVAGVTLVWSAAGVDGTVPMAQVGGGVWEGSIPAQHPDTDVRYHVEATDGANSATEPEATELSFRVYLPAPTGLVAPEGRVVATTATLSWTPPESAHAVLGYEVVSGGATVAEVVEATATVALSGGEEGFAVRAVYEAGAGDLSESVTVDGVLPELQAVDPASGWASDAVRVHVTGDYLLLVDGDVQVSFGEGITVGDIAVRDVDTAIVEVVIDADAAPGPRTVVVQSGDNRLELPDAFTVLDGEDRPRLLTVSPEMVRQGDSGNMTLTYVGDLTQDPTVNLGEGVVVESVDTSVAGEITVAYVVAADAPLGDRAPTADDGVRVFEGPSFEVKDSLPKSARTCGPLPMEGGTPALLVSLLAAAAAARRRRT